MTNPPLPAYGIRSVSILPRRKKPVGHVAYCTPCDWSTRIILGTELLSSFDRADIILANHLKSRTHIQTRSANRELQKASAQVDKVDNGSK